MLLKYIYIIIIILGYYSQTRQKCLFFGTSLLASLWHSEFHSLLRTVAKRRRPTSTGHHMTGRLRLATFQSWLWNSECQRLANKLVPKNKHFWRVRL